MTATEIVLLVVVLLLVVAAVAAAVVVRSRRRAQLQSTFGPEYDRTVERTGGRSAAERELAERAERRRSLDIRPLPETDRLAYAERWRSTQADFVDRPGEAVRAADQLVTEVMAQRGYPVEDPEQMARDVSVDHAETVEQYRSAQSISQLNDRGQASTEQLRRAMVHYRALFDDLLSDGGRPATDTGTSSVRSDGVSDDTGDRPAVDERRTSSATHEDHYGEEPQSREPVEVVHVERTPLGDARPDRDDRRPGTRVEQGGLHRHGEGASGPPSGAGTDRPVEAEHGGLTQPDRPREVRPLTEDRPHT